VSQRLHAGGLGRQYLADQRDAAYPMATLLPGQRSARPYRYWQEAWWGNQGQTPECTAYAGTSWLTDGPVLNESFIDPNDLYLEEKKIDGLPLGSEGSTVRACMQVLQGKGFVANYYWATGIDDVITAVLDSGPVDVGTNWYESFFDPTSEFELVIDETKISPETGKPVAGGHSYLLNGIDMRSDHRLGKPHFRMKNSWGRDWGNKGVAYISFDTMSRLLAEQGEASIALETPVA
jgi:Papain family cysteine protease